jgi:hypothetical protein
MLYKQLPAIKRQPKMPTLSSMKIPPPISWEEFEEITLDACKIRWENPDLQMHGRKGQAQTGVDIYGANHIFRNIGVQCKNYESEISPALIKAEIKKAESFIPKIEMFYLATTTKTDVNIQREIRLLSQERTKEDKFPVMVLFWTDIIQDLIRNPSIIKKHYPQLSLTELKSSKAKNIRLFSILDLVYNTLNLDFYNGLIFGDFGQMTEENPLQIQSAILTIKYSSSNVLSQSEYKKMARLIDNYKEYLFHTGERLKDFSWDIAEKISNEFTGIVNGIEYNLTAKELAIFNIAKILTKWSKWEVDSESYWPKSSWEALKTFVSRIEINELTKRIDELESEYEEMDHFKRLNQPHKVYNEIRHSLIHQTE